MADVHTKNQRSYNMSRIRSLDTKPEIKLRKILWREGLRYTKNNHDVSGKPDIVFRKQKIAVFIDGCFWHKCPEHYNKPKNNEEFWEIKINSNTQRDRKINEQLTNQGWKVFRIWEHDIRNNCEGVKSLIINALGKDNPVINKPD